MRLFKNVSLVSVIFLMALSPVVQVLAQTQEPGNTFTVIVFDRSGSMSNDMTGGKKIEIAKKVLKDELSKLPPQSNVGLLSFYNSEFKVNLKWEYPFGKIDPDALAMAIDGIGVGGGTPLSDAMKVSADRLLKIRSQRYNYKDKYQLLVVTDGEANNDDRTVQFAQDILGKNIELHVIGVAMSGNHALATNFRTSYLPADDPEAFVKAVREIFSETPANQADQEAVHAVMQSLPEEMIKGMLTALGTPNNTPIGEVKAVSREVHDGFVPTTNQPPQSSNSGSNIGIIFLVLFVFILLVIVGIGLSRL